MPGADGNLVELRHFLDRPANRRAVLAELRSFLADIKAERALIHVAALDARIKRHRVGIVRIDPDSSKESAFIFVERERSGACPAENERRIVIDKRPHVAADNAGERAALDRLRRPRPKLVYIAENCKIALNHRIASAILARFFARGETCHPDRGASIRFRWFLHRSLLPSSVSFENRSLQAEYNFQAP